jgi:cell wall-associated NlpC family hydrolase
VRRLLGLTILVALGCAPGAGAQPSAPSWAQADVRLVVARGLLPKSAISKPDSELTQGQLADLVARLSFRAAAPPLDRDSPVTLAQLDAKLVGSLGLSASASSFAQAVRGAGLKPPSRFGTDVVARLLGLRTNHPAARDALELRHDEPATLAETAYSVARILKFKGSEIQSVRTAALAFTLPTLEPWQKRVLTTAVGRIGLPYIWGGTSDRPQAPQGIEVNGGFDCSGFVWHVFKQPYSGGAALAAVFKGRTAAAMAGEVPRAKRIPFAHIRPADAVFFGAAGPRSKPRQVDHVGIALGNGWMIHSSRHGVALVELTGWYRDRFAWARRVLSEAGVGGGSTAGVIPPGVR